MLHNERCFRNFNTWAGSYTRHSAALCCLSGVEERVVQQEGRGLPRLGLSQQLRAESHAL